MKHHWIVIQVKADGFNIAGLEVSWEKRGPVDWAEHWTLVTNAWCFMKKINLYSITKIVESKMDGWMDSGSGPPEWRTTLFDPPLIIFTFTLCSPLKWWRTQTASVGKQDCVVTSCASWCNNIFKVEKKLFCVPSWACSWGALGNQCLMELLIKFLLYKDGNVTYWLWRRTSGRWFSDPLQWVENSAAFTLSNQN